MAVDHVNVRVKDERGLVKLARVYGPAGSPQREAKTEETERKY
jgi:hypothetical protein